jgi:hypothetical protein
MDLAEEKPKSGFGGRCVLLEKLGAILIKNSSPASSSQLTACFRPYLS